ncbi:MAG: hypothetical protein QOJ65_2082 [Fimbriimonadaceae bacterium]|jgi:plastocyanin|nr:hypothetical protein [Fimbriimonadaceae bacterium]
MSLRWFLGIAGLAVMSSAFAGDVTGHVVMSGGRDAAQAVVYLEGAVRSKPMAKQMIDQRNREFIPRISVVTIGTTVDFPNNDTVFHNVFAEYQAKRFDLGMYPRGAKKRQIFEKPGLVAMMCSVHSEMSAYMMVVDTPYFAVADRTGRFTIKGVAPGTYTLRVWHESGQIESRPLVVNDQVVSLEVRTNRK